MKEVPTGLSQPWYGLLLGGGGLPVAETIWKPVLNPCMSLGRAGEGHLDRMAMWQVVRWLRHPRSLIGGGVHSPSLWASSYLDTCLADVTEIRVDKIVPLQS